MNFKSTKIKVNIYFLLLDKAANFVRIFKTAAILAK